MERSLRVGLGALILVALVTTTLTAQTAMKVATIEVKGMVCNA